MENMRVMPVLLLDETVPYPKCNYTISVDEDKYLEAIKAAMGTDSYIMLVNAKFYDNGITEGNIFRIGTVAKIKNAIRGLDGGIKLSVRCTERAYIDSVQKNKELSLCQLESMVEINTADEEKTNITIELLQELFAKYRGSVPILQPQLINEVKSIRDLGTLCDKLADKLVKSFADKRAVLEETDIYERALLTIRLIEKEIKRADIKNDIIMKARENMEDAQKEYFLREELKAINEELGDKSGVGEEIAGYRKKMAELDMPEYAIEKLEKEFDRLKRVTQGTAEGSIIRDYIDNVLSLP